MKLLALRNPNERWLIDFDLIVHSFHSAIGQPELGPGQDSIQVASQHAHKFLERLQPRPGPKRAIALCDLGLSNVFANFIRLVGLIIACDLEVLFHGLAAKLSREAERFFQERCRIPISSTRFMCSPDPCVEGSLKLGEGVLRETVRPNSHPPSLAPARGASIATFYIRTAGDDDPVFARP